MGHEQGSQFVDEPLLEAAMRIAASTFTMAMTGAGVSVPSGIPDFRAHDGLWSRFDISEYATISAFRSNPEKVWRMFHAVEESVFRARPNPAHLALAELESIGRLHCLVTQNIDGLHHQAGSVDVQEFHGSCRRYSCVFCGERFSHEEVATLPMADGIPRCRCGKQLKPDIVLFGEGIPPEAMRRSFAAARQAETILVVGTSAQVGPASELPLVVASRGGLVVEMNLGHTELSNVAHIRILGDVSVTLPALVAEVKRQLGTGKTG